MKAFKVTLRQPHDDVFVDKFTFVEVEECVDVEDCVNHVTEEFPWHTIIEVREV